MKWRNTVKSEKERDQTDNDFSNIRKLHKIAANEELKKNKNSFDQLISTSRANSKYLDNKEINKGSVK